jgi:hypothetical protein
MAGYGPPPSENRRRRNADRYEGLQVTVNAEGVAEAPELPGKWPAVVRRWYQTWASSPQAETFLVTDWQRLHMLAPLVAKYFLEPDKTLMAEIRLNESLLGATHVDRLRARIKVADDSGTTAAAKGPVVDDEVAKKRRQRILDAS